MLFRLEQAKVRKREAMITNLDFLTQGEFQERRENLETWSQICVDHLDRLLAWPLEVALKTVATRPFETRTMARQCYASHKRNGRRVSSAASQAFLPCLICIATRPQQQGRCSLRRKSLGLTLALVPKDAGLWVL